MKNIQCVLVAEIRGGVDGHTVTYMIHSGSGSGSVISRILSQI